MSQEHGSRTRRARGVAALAATLVLAVVVADARGQAFVRSINFGDSLSDVGNTNALTFGISPGGDYYDGRFSNGSLWVEGLANRLNLGATTTDRRGGYDYATGGTRTGSGNVTPFPFINLPNANTQIDRYLNGRTPGADDLFTVWTGANDFLDGQTDPTIPANNIKAHVQRLISAGAKSVLVVNLPPLGETPRFRNNATDRATMNARASQFNATLATNLDALAAASPQATIYRADMFSFFQQAIGNPSAFGLGNVTEAALRSDGSVAPNPDSYLFYDNIHPTRVGHALVADIAFDIVTTRTWNTSVGGGSANWHTATNWVQRRVPDSTSAVSLTAFAPISVQLSSDANVRSFKIGQVDPTVPPGFGTAVLRVNGAKLSVSSGTARVGLGGTISGHGVIDGGLTLVNGGAVSPGDGGTQAINQIAVLGTFALEAGGTFAAQLGANGASDRIAVNGTARLKGTIALSFVEGYIGLPGSQATLVTATAIDGVPTLLNQTGFAGLSFVPIATATSLAISLSATGGDADLDAAVDFDDLLVLARNYQSSAVGLTWLGGDFTADARVDFDDLLVLARNYGVSQAAFEADWALAQSLVPEPISLTGLLALVPLAQRRRRP